MVSEIESYSIYNAYISANWSEEAATALQRFLKSESSYIRRRIGKQEDAIEAVSFAILEESNNQSASKLSYVSSGKTLGLILETACNRINQGNRRIKAKQPSVNFDSELLEEAPSESVQEPELYSIKKVEEWTCTVKEFAQLLGMRYQEVRRLIQRGQVISSKGRIKALDAFKRLGIATPTLDRSAGF